MKIYGIAVETHECYGHGDFGNELRIVKLGPYGAGPFPPLFAERQYAEEFIRKATPKSFQKLQVVELELMDWANSYESLKKGLTGLPATWYPGILAWLVEESLTHRVWKPGGCSRLVREIEAQPRHAYNETQETSRVAELTVENAALKERLAALEQCLADCRDVVSVASCDPCLADRITELLKKS